MAQVIRVDVYTLDDSLDAYAVADQIDIADAVIITDWTTLNMRDIVDSLDKSDLADLGFVLCCECGDSAHRSADESVPYAEICDSCGSDICEGCSWYCEKCEAILCSMCTHTRDEMTMCKDCFEEKKCKKHR